MLKEIFLQLARLSAIFFVLLLFYISLVQVWRISSPDYQPVGIFDHVARKAPPVEEWIFKRRQHGV